MEQLSDEDVKKIAKAVCSMLNRKAAGKACWEAQQKKENSLVGKTKESFRLTVNKIRDGLAGGALWVASKLATAKD